MNINLDSTFQVDPPPDLSIPNLIVKETIPDLVNWARNKSPRSHLLEVLHYPIFFVVVEIKDDQSYVIHTRRETQPMIERPITFQSTGDVGYAWYQEDLNNTDVRFTKEKFTRTYTSVCNKVSELIKTHHGILCSDTSENGNESQQFVLHFGDILVLKLLDCFGFPKPKLSIVPDGFGSIPNNMFDTFFQPGLNFENMLSEEEMTFLIVNADLFFHIFCYWHNNSNKPVRTQVLNVPGLRRSNTIVENVYFLGNQVAKMDELRRRTQGIFTRKLYLCD